MTRQFGVVRCQVVRPLGNGQVEAHLLDAYGQTHQLIQPAAFFDGTPGAYPAEAALACEIITALTPAIYRVSTRSPWGVTTPDGRSEFDVTHRALTQPRDGTLCDEGR